MPHHHQCHAAGSNQIENQKRQVISHRDYRYWLERRRPRVYIHESTSAALSDNDSAREGDEGHV